MSGALPVASGPHGSVDLLRQRTLGDVLEPADEGFDTRCRGFQTGYRHRPSVLVRPAGAEDVTAAVAHAAGRGLTVAVQATGHGLSAPCEGGLLIDTSAMTGVTVDAASRTARVLAGTRFADVVEAAARYGLAPLNGSSPGVGAVGYVLGGGLGLLGRQFGYAADHVDAVELVTADARHRQVTADSDPELFWALRGAGANFGVVTAMEIGLVPVTRIYGGELVLEAENPMEVVDAYRRWSRSLPERLTSSLSLVDYPDLPVFPGDLRGRRVAHVRIAYTGDARKGAELVAPMRDCGRLLSDTVAEMPYTECGSLYNDPPMPHAYVGDNVLLREFGATEAAVVAEFVESGPVVPCVVDVRHLGGAFARVPEVPNAVGHRDAGYLVRVLSPILDGDPDKARALHRGFLGELSASAVGRCQNLAYGADGDGSPEPPNRDFWNADDHLRLAALKARVDPANMFRHNRNILPA